MITLQPVLILSVIFGSILGIVYLSNRKKERMMVIERGLDPDKYLCNKVSTGQSLKYGLLLIGVALGILIGNVLSGTESFVDVPEAAYFSMIFLFGGLALVISHFLVKKQINETDNKE